MTTTMNQRTAPEITTLAEMTVTAICLDVSRNASLECGLGGDLSEDVVTWSIVIQPSLVEPLVAALPPPEQRRIAEDPGWLAHCGNTATRLFWRLTTNENVVGIFANLASHVATAAESQERVAFYVRYLNHEFIIIARNGFAEILQSFDGKYSLGRCLMRQGTSYLPAVLQRHLSDIASPDVQKRIFFHALREDSPRAEYNYAPLKTDREIWDSLYEEAAPGLACYLSLRGSFQVPAP